MSATPSTAQTVTDTTLATLKALLPTLIAAGAAGAAATNPTAATIEAVLPDLLAMYKAGTMSAAQVTTMTSALVDSVESNQQVIDAYAKSKGVTDPTKTTASAPVSGA